MSTDRELLEKAARAAGYEFGYINDELRVMIPGACGTYGCTKPHSTRWNPLADDADALRLAVKLGLTINPYQEGVFVSRYEGEEVCGEPFEQLGVPDAAATRRAIVRAAASIGEGA